MYLIQPTTFVFVVQFDNDVLLLGSIFFRSKPRTFLLIRTNVTHNQPTNANNMTHISFPFEISHQSVSQSVMMARKPWCREPDRDSEAQRIGGEARASGRPPGELSIERKLPLPVDVHQLRRGCRRRTHRRRLEGL